LRIEKKFADIMRWRISINCYHGPKRLKRAPKIIASSSVCSEVAHRHRDGLHGEAAEALCRSSLGVLEMRAGRFGLYQQRERLQSASVARRDDNSNGQRVATSQRAKLRWRTQNRREPASTSVTRPRKPMPQQLGRPSTAAPWARAQPQTGCTGPALRRQKPPWRSSAIQPWLWAQVTPGLPS
jgi:hypothetical protein